MDGEADRVEGRQAEEGRRVVREAAAFLGEADRVAVVFPVRIGVLRGDDRPYSRLRNPDADAGRALVRRHAADVEGAAMGEEAARIVGIEGDRDQPLAGIHALDVDVEPDGAGMAGAAARAGTAAATAA